MRSRRIELSRMLENWNLLIKVLISKLNWISKFIHPWFLVKCPDLSLAMNICLFQTIPLVPLFHMKTHLWITIKKISIHIYYSLRSFPNISYSILFFGIKPSASTGSFITSCVIGHINSNGISVRLDAKLNKIDRTPVRWLSNESALVKSQIRMVRSFDPLQNTVESLFTAIQLTYLVCSVIVLIQFPCKSQILMVLSMLHDNNNVPMTLNLFEKKKCQCYAMFNEKCSKKIFSHEWKYFTLT